MNWAIKARINNRITIQGAVFYSKINNTIQMVSNVKRDTVRNVWQSQLQNVGKSIYSGAEAGITYQPAPSFEGGLNYTFIERKNKANPALYFTDVPKHKVFAFVHYRLRDKASIQVNTSYNSKRYSTTYGTIANSFMLLNTTASAHIWKWFSVEAGINNITDKNYSLVEGYPEPGRNYFANVVYRL